MNDKVLKNLDFVSSLQTLMTISSIGTALFFSVLATYLYLKKTGVDLSNLGWIPIMSLSLVIFIASLGIISLPFVITTELMPTKVNILRKW